MDIEIVPMTIDDITYLENDFSLKFDKFWSISTLKDDFKNEHSHYIIAKYMDEIVGFAGILQVIDESEIMNIVVRNDMRKMGIGSKLLNSIIQMSAYLHCNTINLEVNSNNYAAIHLYEKYNFERIGLRKKYYNNTDDAILMQRRITNEK